jgi:hypothetical protein
MHTLRRGKKKTCVASEKYAQTTQNIDRTHGAVRPLTFDTRHLTYHSSNTNS